MVVSDKFKFVYIDPPKTASASLDRVFSSYGGYVVPITPTNTKHNRIIPGTATSYTKIASIRNPYTRLASHYWFEYERGKKVTFEEYIDFHLSILDKEDNELKPTIYRYFPLVKYLSIFKKIDHIIRLESIQQDLNKIPFYKNTKLGHLHKLKHPTLVDMNLSKSLWDKIDYWAKYDCDAYGYSKP